jgi:cytochrome c biogenesis protein CcdA
MNQECTAPITTADELACPVVHKVKRRWVWFILLWASVFVALGLAAASWAVLTVQPSVHPFNYWQIVICGWGIVLLGIAFMALTFHWRLTLHRDAIEIRQFVHIRRLARHEITGKRVYRERPLRMSREVIVLQSSQPGRKRLIIEVLFRPTRAFKEWIAAIPDIT